MTDKRLIRIEARAARAAFGHHPIVPPPEFTPLLAPGLTVASYVPVGSEADPATLEDHARAAGCRLALPHVVDRTTPLRFLAWSERDGLEPGPFGLVQPPAHADELAPDLILTPLVAFDAALNRIGQGAGHYDRAFAAFPQAKRIGVAYSVQQVGLLMPDPWDLPLDAVVTERGWITR
jgi:5-formyltetrahydrofolate cyclo-ligase